MSQGALKAVFVAIDCFKVPSRVPRARHDALPDGMETLLRIVSGDAEATAEAALATGRSETTITQAAAFFVEQVLFASDADCYRILGAERQAEAVVLRRNMALLSRWIHPDAVAESGLSYMARRLNDAWNQVKTPERRAVYDKVLLDRQNAPRRVPVANPVSRSPSVMVRQKALMATSHKGPRKKQRRLSHAGPLRRFMFWVWYRFARSSQ